MEDQLPTNNDNNGVESAKEHLAILRAREVRWYPPCANYLRNTASDDNDEDDDLSLYNNWLDRENPLYDQDRTTLCQWLFDMMDYMGIRHGIAGIAMDFLDRTAALWVRGASPHLPRSPLNWDEYHLLTLVSLSLAIKTNAERSEDGHCYHLKMGRLRELGSFTFSVDQICTAERRMLMALNWNLNPPTTMDFLLTLLNIFKPRNEDQENTVHAYAASLSEMTLYYLECNRFTRLEMAVACAFAVARKLLPTKEAVSERQQALRILTGVSDATVRAIHVLLQRLAVPDLPLMVEAADNADVNSNEDMAKEQDVSSLPTNDPPVLLWEGPLSEPALLAAAPPTGPIEIENTVTDEDDSSSLADL